MSGVVLSKGFEFTDCAPAYWQIACEYLSGLHPVWSQLIGQYQDAFLQSRGQPFETLVRSIVGQQISIKAADAVFLRLLGLFEHSLSPQAVLDCSVDALRKAGLSARKVEYLHNLSQFTLAGGLQSVYLNQLSDVECVHHLLQVKGIGRWTAEMFLIFNLLRPDVWPVDDIGLLKALGLEFLSGQTPDRRQALEMGEAFRPYRTVACWYLWRSIDPVVVNY
jgi:DNA-3-methyladenine glycosylase II